jgi:parvulin-like peptidyl-prolyl isomerase
VILWLDKKGEIIMKNAILILCLAALAAFSLTCGTSEDKAVARMAGQVITAGMIKEHYLAISQEARPELPTFDEQEQFARDVVSKEILTLEARKMGIDKLPEVAQATSNAIQRKAWEVFFEERVRSVVEVTDADIQELHEKQRYSYHLRWIFLRSQVQADEVSRRLAAGEDFSALARIYSMDPSMERGGDIGARPLGTLPQAVEDRVNELSPGGVTDAFNYDSYYVIIKLESKEEQQVQDLEGARAGLEAMIRTRAETAVQRKLAREIQEKYGVTFVPDALETIARRTRELYSSEDVPIGLVPKFSDEELARNLAHYEGGEWRIRTYTEKINMQVPSMRPRYGTDSETIKSVIGDFITGELWMVEIQNGGYTQRPEVLALANRVREEAMITALHEELVRNVEVNEEDLRSFYEEQKSQMMSEAAVRLAIITFQTEEEAVEVHGLLDAGGSFENLARERSFDRNTGENGGVLRGLLLQAQLETFPDINFLVNGLAVGSYTEPAPMPMGLFPGDYGIFKLLERKESEQIPFEEVRAELSERVLQFEQDRAFGEWLVAKMEEYEVEIYPAGLESIDFRELRGQ